MRRKLATGNRSVSRTGARRAVRGDSAIGAIARPLALIAAFALTVLGFGPLLLAGPASEHAEAVPGAPAISLQPMVYKFLGAQDKIDTFRDEIRFDFVLRVPTGSVNYRTTLSTAAATGLNFWYRFNGQDGEPRREAQYKNTLGGATGADSWHHNIDEFYTIHEVITSGPYDYLVMSLAGDLDISDGLSGSNVVGGAPNKINMDFWLSNGLKTRHTFNYNAYQGRNGADVVTGPQVQLVWDNAWNLIDYAGIYWGAVLDHGVTTLNPARTFAPGIFPQNAVAVALQNSAFSSAGSGPACSITTSFWYAWVYSDGTLVTDINTAPVHITGVNQADPYGNNTVNAANATYNATFRGSPQPGMVNIGQPELAGGAMKADGSIDFAQVHASDSRSDDGYYRLMVWPESKNPSTITQDYGAPCLSYAASDLVDTTGAMTDAAEKAAFTTASIFYQYEIPLPEQVVIATPANETTIADRTPVISGTGTPGMTVTLKNITNPVQHIVLVDGYYGSDVTVAADGTWSWEVPTDMADGNYVIQAEQTEHTTGYELTSLPVKTAFTLDSKPNAAKSSMVLDPVDGTADAGDLITATVTVNNVLGEPLGGQPVTFTKKSSAVSLSASTCVTSNSPGDDYGKCSITVTSDVEGDYLGELSAKISVNGTLTEIGIGSPADVHFQANEGDPTKSSLTVTPKHSGATVPLLVGTADASTYVAEVTIKTKNNIPVEGQAVNFSVTKRNGDPVDPVKTKLSHPTCDTVHTTGKCSITVTSTEAGDFDVHATIPSLDANPVDTELSGSPSSPQPASWKPDVASHEHSSFTVSATSATVGTETVTGRVTVKDQYGNTPTPGTVVDFSVTGHAEFVVGTQADRSKASCTVNTGDYCQVTFRDTTAEHVTVKATIGTATVPQPHTVEFVRGEISFTTSTYSVEVTGSPSAVSAPADGVATWTGTLSAKDKEGNPIKDLDLTGMEFLVSCDEDTPDVLCTDPTVVVIDGPRNHNDGRYTVTYATEKAGVYGTNVRYGDKHISASSKPITFTAGTPAGSASSLKVAPISASVGGTVDATVTIKDSLGNLVPGVTAQVTTTGGARVIGTCVTSTVYDSTYGTCTVRVTDDVAETVKVNATVGTPAQTVTGSGVDVTFGFGAPDARYSSISATPSTQSAGTDVKVTVTVKDADKKGIDNLTANQFLVTGVADGVADLMFRDFANMGSGVYTFNTTSKLVGTFTLSADVAGVKLTQHPTVTFTANGVCVSNCTPIDNPKTPQDESVQNVTKFVLTADGATADGNAQDTITAYAYDTYGNKVTTGAVLIVDQTTSPLNGKLTPSAAQCTITDGVCTVGFSSFAAGKFTVYGTVDSLVPATAVQNPSFTPGNVSAAKSTLVVAPAQNTVGESAMATVTAYDATGLNKVGDVPIMLTGSSADLKIGGQTTYMCTTNNVTGSPSFGTCSIDVTSKIVGNYTVAGAIGGVGLGTGPQPVEFRVGTVCFENCTPVDRPDTPDVNESTENYTHVKVTQNGQQADGSGVDKVTAFAYDQFGNPVKDAQVATVKLTPSLNAPTGTFFTDADGRVVLNYTSMTPGEARAEVTINSVEPKSSLGFSPVTMAFVAGRPDPGQSSVAISPATSQQVDSLFTITATIRDTAKHLLDGVTVEFVPSSANGVLSGTTCATVNGVCSVTLTSKYVDTYLVGASINLSGVDATLPGSPVSATFTAGDLCLESQGCVPDPGAPKTSVRVSTDGQAANGVARDVATVEAYDKHGNPVKDAVVNSSTTDSALSTVTPIDATSTEGRSTIYYTSTVPGPHEATVTVDGGAPNGSPIFPSFAGAPGNAGKSSFAISALLTDSQLPLTVGEGDSNTYKVEATVINDFDLPSNGSVVTFDIRPSGPIWNGPASCTTGANGKCSVTIHSTKAGTYAVSARLGQDSIQEAKTVVWKADKVCAQGCVPEDPDTPPGLRTRVVVETDNALANGSARDVARLYAFDKWGNPVPGTLVRSTTTDADLSVQSGVAGTDENGETTIFYTSKVAGAHQASVTVDTANVGVDGSPFTVRFVPGAVNAKNSSLVLDKTSATVGDTVTGTVTARDIHGNLVPNTVVSLTLRDSAEFTGTNAGQSATCATSDSSASYGTCQVTLTDYVAERTPVTATVDVLGADTPITGSGTEVSFGAGSVSGRDSSVEVIPASTTVGKNVLVKVTVKDASGNGITGLAANEFVITGKADGAPDLAFSDFAEGGTGVYTFVTTSTTAAIFTVGVTVDGVRVPVPATVEFTVGSPNSGKSLLEVTPSYPDTLKVGENVNATVTIRDGHGNPISGQLVLLGATGSATTSTPTCTTGDGQNGTTRGVCSFTVTDQVVETVQVSAKLPNGIDVTGSPATAKFTLGCLPGIDADCTYDDSVDNDRRSRVEVTVNNQRAEGGTNIAEARIFDLYGNPAHDAVVTTIPDSDDLVVTRMEARLDPSPTALAIHDMHYQRVPNTASQHSADVLVNDQPLIFIPKPGSTLDTAEARTYYSSPNALEFLDMTAPDAPTITSPTDGDLTNSGTVAVVGTGEPGATVTIKDGGVVVGTTTVTPDGTWAVDISLSDGEHSLVASQKDEAGNQSVDSPAVRVKVDTVAPGDVTAKGNSDSITGKVEGPVDPGTTVDITYPTASGPKTITDVPVNPDGTFTAPTPDDAVSGSLSVVVTDPAGNKSTGEGVIDTDAPGVPALAGNGDNITGTVPGPVDPGTEVVITYPRGDGTTGSITAPVNPDGSFSVSTPDDAISGELEAVAKDPAGNESAPGTGDLDVDAPDPPVVNDSNGSELTGGGEPGGIITITGPDGEKVTCEEGDIIAGKDGSWMCTPKTPLKPGDVITVTVTDPSGNTSQGTTVTIGALGARVAHATRHPGETQTVYGSGFNPGENVCATMYPTPSRQGCAVVDARGHVAITFTVPMDVIVGTHRVVMTGEKSGSAEASFTVSIVEVRTGGVTSAAGTTLVDVLAAVALLAGGAVIFGWTRRRTHVHL